MKTKLALSVLLLALLFCFEKGRAQAPAYKWAKKAGGSGDDWGFSITTDATGNIYVTGHFNSASITFGSFTLINNGDVDIFLVKYDTAGNVIWAKNAGGINYEEVWSITTDAPGNIYISGTFISPSITFGSFTLNNPDTTGLSGDIFIVKYDPAGNIIWAKREGGTGIDVGAGIATDANNNIYVTGGFASKSITFGSFTFNNTDTGTTWNSRDIFIVKYDSAGNVIWAKHAGGTNFYDQGFSISTDANDNICVTGVFDSPSISFGSFTLNNNGIQDIFIVKYDSSGNVMWAESAGGSSDQYSFSVATDASGNSFITGFFNSDSITFGSFTLNNNGIDNIYTVKYDTAGNVIWAKSAGGVSQEYGFSITTDDNGNSYVTGEFSSPSITFGTFTLNNIGIFNIFIVKYDTVGNVIWAESVGGTGWDAGGGITTDANGNIYVTGQFDSPSITFGSTTLNSNNASFDFYITKLSDTPSAINENPYGSNLNIYPNPATDYLTINTNINKKQVITITDITGKIIYSTTTLADKTIINTKDFPQGVYAVQVQAGDAVETRKVVVAR